MKKTLYILVLSLLYISCEDVIEVELPTTEPRLVIEASINWFENTTGNTQTIKLAQTAPFFDAEITSATNAIVTITNTSNTTFNFIDTQNNGNYICTNFIPQINETYTLTIQYNNETYTATETMKSIVPIDYVEQNNGGGFSGDEVEIKAFYTDPEDQENYYLFEIQEQFETNPNVEVYDDEFTNGNQIFAFYTNEDTQAGNQITIKNYGTSKQFYDYMFLLLQQTGQDTAGPFDVQPATVRGNCINTSNPENYPFGYFRVSQATEYNYTVQ